MDFELSHRANAGQKPSSGLTQLICFDTQKLQIFKAAGQQYKSNHFYLMHSGFSMFDEAKYNKI